MPWANFIEPGGYHYEVAYVAFAILVVALIGGAYAGVTLVSVLTRWALKRKTKI